MTVDTTPILSGERFRVTYHLQGDQKAAYDKARFITVEQTVEFPEDLVTSTFIREHIIGRIEAFEPLSPNLYRAVISYAIECTAFELTQFLNMIFGDIASMPGIWLDELDLPESLLSRFKGPRFGIQGLRSLLGVPQRPLLCTALKPLGSGVDEFARQAAQFALGGIDIIKDDHSLTNQPFAPFRERVQRCAAAVAEANAQTGYRCIYMPSITAPADRLIDNAYFAKSVGAGGFLIAPGLVGADTVRRLADDDALALPILNHPTTQGSSFTSRESGMAAWVLFGTLARLMGADAVNFAHYGGRFPTTRADIERILHNCKEPLGNLKTCCPAAGGGVQLEHLTPATNPYGRDVLFVMAGGLHRPGPDLAANSRRFRELAENL